MALSKVFKQNLRNRKKKQVHVACAKFTIIKKDVSKQNNFRIYDKPESVVISYNLLSQH